MNQFICLFDLFIDSKLERIDSHFGEIYRRKKS